MKVRKVCETETGSGKGFHFFYAEQEVPNPDIDCPTHPAADTRDFAILNHNPILPAPQIEGIVPAAGNEGQTIDVDISGKNIQAGAKISLQKDSEDDIIGSNENVDSFIKMVGKFNLTDAAVGLWNVMIKNLDEQFALLIDGFEVIVNGLYTHWHLNETSGIIASDSSGHTYHGTTQNMSDSNWVAGKLNNCLQFDGVDEYVSFGDIANFERTEAFSVEGWVKLTAQGILIGRVEWSTPFRGWYVGTNASGHLQFVMTNIWGSNQLSAYQDAVNMNDNAWHHFVITYDGSSDVVGVKFYVDGVLRTTKGNPSTLTGTIQVTKNCQMDGADGANEMFTGLMDEVIIYSKELSAPDAAFRWNNGDGTEEIP